MVAGRPKLCTARGESPLYTSDPRSFLPGWLYHWALLWRVNAMARGRTGIEHLLRRAGFGASPADLSSFDGMSMSGVVDYLLNFEDQPDDVDTNVGNPSYVSVLNRAGGFQPNSNIED